MSTASPIDVARRAITLLDLTELGDEATPDDVTALCARAVGRHGTVAAVCVWPRHVSMAVQLLIGKGVRIATVVNFPSGNDAIDDVVALTTEALADGADEIDLVLPYRAFLSGDRAAAEAMIQAVRDSVPTPQRLKVILETGELVSYDTIRAASETAIRLGADFIKTSTGKTPRSASLEATEVMLEVIRTASRPVGLKPSGGIRTLDDATEYLDQADRIMGAGWATPTTFRFGASGLLTALEAAIDGASEPTSTTETY
ncbi:MAG: deoxyribose-phosphate aldolase [Actinobacteria bacterium]|uniref:deoxyribose-phosphate aldolase n=1 Tax=freshwater metagenome TaxID=449393 RepID=A0A6J6A720_9ZZZZ|nr:deoxyribose-phosphate aldolase [Actinomycetota bacterium]MSW77390.1 deoxyribose-phosphate aldolase [Actinomycetota bacterium]MSX57095.1 deoxyribose-phosphate aldolase [Actinomycetota bacterium]MSX94452.1 deoxyribose-phosphate aldolase [Actinomycetota bacterium]MSZ82679.1 deoxyribose-phosphate aldolase [Actinomycetota bacterium]